MTTLQTQKKEYVQQEINPLEIQNAILQIFNEYQEESFYPPLLKFVAALTNCRAILLLEKQAKKICILEESHSEEDDKWEHLSLMITKLVAQTFGDKKTHINKINKDGQKWHAITTPIMIRQKFPRALSLVIEVESEDELTPFILIIQLIAAYIPFVFLGESARKKEAISDRTAVAIELIQQAMRHKDLFKSSQIVAEKIQKHLDCQRVVIGLKKKLSCKVIAMSDLESFDKRGSLVKSIEAAMQESAREQNMIYYPLPDVDKRTLQVDISHEKLKNYTNALCIISVPMYDYKEKIIAVWTFVWDEDSSPKQGDVDLIKAITPHIADIVSLLKNMRPNFMIRIWNKLTKIATRLRNWFMLLCLIGIIFGLRLPWTHYVVGSCQVTPIEKHTIAAPFAGVIRNIYCKPGDSLQKNQLLAKLDDRELRIELAAAQQSLAGTRRKMALLFAEEKMADYQITTMDARKTQEKMKLLQYRLKNLEIRASSFGILLQGDLEDAIGAPVKLGQVLFNIAPVKKLLLEVYIDERDINYVKVNMEVELQINSHPDKRWKSSVAKVLPVSEIKEGLNIFICEVPLDNKENELLPGMNGDVRIIVGEQPIWWLWLHRPMTWVKEKMWW